MSWVITGSQKVNWDPSLISTALWLDANATGTMYDATSGGSNVVNGGAISRWEDRSGNNRHATASTTARPTRVDNSLNGKPIVSFNGTSNTMTAAVTAGALSSGCGVVLVFNGTGALPVTTRFANTADPFDAFSATRRVGNGSTQTTLTGATWYNLNAVSTGTVYSLGVAPTVVSEHVNGSLFASQAGPHSFGDTNSLTTVGGTNAIYFTGQLAEAILIPGFLFDDVRQKTEGYLAHKWGLTASLPSGHPYKVNPPAP